MITAALSPVANHLWQSTVFAAAAGLLTLALRRNRASVRYGIWLAASLKFLVPFSLLVSLGGEFGWRTAPVAAQPQLSFLLEEIGRPFAATVPATRAAATLPAGDLIAAVLAGLWACGFAVVVFSWLRSGRRVRAAIRA